VVVYLVTVPSISLEHVLHTVFTHCVLTLVNTLPGKGDIAVLRTQWALLLNDNPDLPTTKAVLPYLHQVHRFTVPTAFTTLLQEVPTPCVQPTLWTIGCDAVTRDPVVGQLALVDSVSPLFWVGYAHPHWQWTPAGVCWLLWQGIIQQDETALTKAATIYDWLTQKGYGYLPLEHALQQLAASTPHKSALDDAMLPPAVCPFSREEWYQAKSLLPTLQRGLIISASDAPTDHPLFGSVAQAPNTPWTIVHTGWLWLLDTWLHEGKDALRLDAVNALLRQSIDTVVLHRMLASTTVTEGVA
jgi:hypothetical protein